MRQAPSIRYPVVRSTRCAWGLAALGVPGTAAVGWWIATVPAPLPLRITLVVWMFGIGTWAARQWWSTPDQGLDWDGQRWSLCALPSAHSDGKNARPMPVEMPVVRLLTVSIDFQHAMVLKLNFVRGAARWIFIERPADPARWHALRCAVNASAGRRLEDNDPAAERA